MTEAATPESTHLPAARPLTALAAHASTSANEQQLTDVHARLKRLSSSGAEHFDPVRWHYVNTLLRRREEQGPRVARAITGRVGTLLADYETAFQGARMRAEQALANITANAPSHAKAAQQLFHAGQFRELACLNTRLARLSPQNPFYKLTQRLNQQLDAADHHPQNTAFANSLRQQDWDINAGAEQIHPEPAKPSASVTEAPPASTTNTANASPFRALKAARYVHASRQQHHAQRLLNRAIAQCPADSGPLNPEMLIIRSLTTMHGLSPHYAKRLVTQTHSLLWLEQAGAQLIAKKTQKKAPSKKAKKRR